VEVNLYERFVIVIPRHVAVPRHEYATEEEIKMLTDDYFIDPKNQAAIFESDAPIVWLGARKGAIIKITRIDENAGVSIAFRVVV
jgi:DNA-directed RNA polymerase subunit H (RpoH/RPB5)